MSGKGHLDVQVTLRQMLHGVANSVERTNEASAKGECRYCRDEQSTQTPDGDPDRLGEHNRLDIVGVDARLDCEQLFALAIAAGVGELRLGTTCCLRYLVLEKSSAGAGFANDVLDHQLAIMVPVIPAVDIDVFRVGMHVGYTGIRAAGAIDSEIVAGFAPAHGADRVKSKLPCVHRRNLAGPGLLLVIREDFLCRLDH